MQKYVRRRNVNLVDLVKSFPTSIYLQKSASIQPRTSPSKFEGKFNSLFTSLLSSAGTLNCDKLEESACARDMHGAIRRGSVSKKKMTRGKRENDAKLAVKLATLTRKERTMRRIRATKQRKN